MYTLKPTKKFKKQIKVYKFNKKVLDELDFILSVLILWKSLDKKYLDHGLKWRLSDYRECHLFPDVLFMYKIEWNDLLLARIWSHNNIFK